MLRDARRRSSCCGRRDVGGSSPRARFTSVPTMRIGAEHRRHGDMLAVA
jgi:hypothetical protein